MEVTRIHDGLWRWAVHRDGSELASAYIEHGDAMLLVDPVLPASDDDRDRFARAIERDLARLGGPVWVMATQRDDPRDADALMQLTGGSAWLPGDPAPAGMTVVPTGRSGEVALWSAPHSALMPGSALVVDHGVPRASMGVDATSLLALGAEVVIPSVGPMAPYRYGSPR